MIIDLTRKIESKMPVTPFYKEPIKIEWLHKFPEEYSLSRFVIYTHRGTHIDAPHHFIENGKKIDEIDTSRFIGKGCLIDLSDKKREIITLGDLPELKIEKSQIILFYTGLEKYWEKPLITRSTEISEEVAKHLIEYEPKMVGIDSQTFDSSKNGFRAHKIVLGADIPIIEGLVNLDKLVDKEFDVMAFPLKIEGLEASPARVLAKVK